MTGEWTDVPPEPPDPGPGDDGLGPDQPEPPTHSDLSDHIYGHADSTHDLVADVDGGVDRGVGPGGYDVADGDIEQPHGDPDDWGTELSVDAEQAAYPISTADLADSALDESASPAISAGQEWVSTLGVGGVDPGGELPAVFTGLDLDDPSTAAYDSDDSWSYASDLDADHWTEPGLLDGLDALPTSNAGVAEDDRGGAAGIEALWERLSPGEPLPTTQSGASDLSTALDLLAARAGTTPLLDVIDAARRLVGH